MKKDIKEEIKSVLDRLSNHIEDEEEVKYGELVRQHIVEYDYLDIKSPDDFSLLVANAIESQKEILIRLALEDVLLGEEKRNQIGFVYSQYQFIENHLDRLIVDYEGPCCSSDKTMWLITSYIEYIKTDKLPTIDSNKYWQPRVEDASLWMNWISSMSNLYFGISNEYFTLKNSIEEKYKTVIEKRIHHLNKVFTEHEKFISNEVKKNDEEQTYYYFKDEETGNKGTIAIDSKGNTGYNFYLESEKRLAKYSDTHPEWFLKLARM